MVFGLGAYRLGHGFDRGKRHQVLVHHHGRGLFAASNAGGGDHAHVVAAQNSGQARQQVLRTGQRAAQAVAHAHREAWGRGVAFKHFKVVVEGGHLIDLGHRNVHLLGQCHQVAVVQSAKTVVEHVQIFDQQVAPVRPGAQQCAHFGHGGVLGLVAFEFAFAADALAHVVHRGQSNGGRGGLGSVWARRNRHVVNVKELSCLAVPRTFMKLRAINAQGCDFGAP